MKYLNSFQEPSVLLVHQGLLMLQPLLCRLLLSPACKHTHKRLLVMWYNGCCCYCLQLLLQFSNQRVPELQKNGREGSLRLAWTR